MTTTHPIRCRCGAFEAELSHPERGTRAICYCRDCQAFAAYLNHPDGMLDALGGTDVIAVRPRYVRFLRGEQNLACMSLSPTGTLRWFTRCCRTPIGNTPRDYRESHVGLVHTCLEQGGPPLDESFGPVRMRVNRHGAKGKPEGNAPLGFFFAVLRYVGSVTWTRLGGKYRINPFFDGEGHPKVQPQILSPAERAGLS